MRGASRSLGGLATAPLHVTREASRRDLVCLIVALGMGCTPHAGADAPADSGLRLAPTGVVVNPVVQGGAVWAILVLPVLTARGVRRWSRRRRGLCPACAYPAGASDVCTECGAPRRS